MKELISNCEILTRCEDLVCNTPVPYYDMGISCGLPNEMGDVPPEMMMVPDMLTKKDFFTEMGCILHIDLSDYDKDLSRSMSDSTKLDKHLKVFEDMKQKMIEIWNSR